ncbi:MAG: outer membrane beta-barrel protein [Hyphomicrobiales bacterium]|nr:outer membrane beta-barrel protein [Hyphomicrobiales bacterium]
MATPKLGTSVLLVSAALVGAGDAVAQGAADEPKRGDTVTTKQRDELDPLGVRVGSFLLFPKLTVTETYDDNIFATEHDEEDDFITNIMPELSLQSNWNTHALNIATGADQSIYADSSNDSEETLDYFGKIDGRLDVTQDIKLLAGAGFSRNTEGRSDPDTGGGRKPDRYNQIDSFLRYDHTFGRFNALVDGTFRRLDFEDVPGNINNDDRDRNIYEGGLRLGYEILPEYEAFVRGSGNRRIYDETPDDGGRDRDSYGYAINTGVALDLGGLLFGDIFVGYLNQTFPDDNEDSVDGLNFGGSLDWNVTPLTTISALVSRQVRETTQDNSTGRLTTLGELSVDHELLRNLLLNANGAIIYDDYEGSKREDLTYEAGAGIKYLMFRNFYAGLSYTFTRRSSDDAIQDDDFTRNLVMISLEGQF